MTSLKDIAEMLGTQIVIRSRDIRRMSHCTSNDVWYACLENCDIKDDADDPTLTGVMGNGRTPGDALVDLAGRLCDKLLIYRSHSKEERVELLMPSLLEVHDA